MKLIGPASETDVATAMLPWRLYLVGPGSWIASDWSNWPGDRMIQLPWERPLDARPYRDGLVYDAPAPADPRAAAAFDALRTDIVEQTEIRRRGRRRSHR